MRRRIFLGGLGAGLAGRVLADTRMDGVRPLARPDGIGAPVQGAAAQRTGALDLIAAADLGGRTGYALCDVATGAIIEAVEPDAGLPPASTAKAATALYALETLGQGHRFRTRVLATGAVSGGTLSGDLVLAGGGDPTLTTDNLAELALAVARSGIRHVAGRFRVWGGALPYIREIDRDQPDWLGYNPSVGGLNLNFNRVNFTWQRQGTDYLLGMNAEDRNFVPAVSVARVAVADRDLPVYTYAEHQGFEDWTVSRAALGGGGSRWLPVRHPDLYAGDVFRTLAAGAGLALPPPEPVADLPTGQTIAQHESAALPEILRAMMRYSTNITAEAVGMAASVAHGVGHHAGSCRAMSDWIGARTGQSGLRFVDHSGLGGGSRVTPLGMARALGALGPKAGLADLMKQMTPGEDGEALPASVRVKTGTLNFASGLVGFLPAPSGRSMVFAIFSADVDRRDRLSEAERERPPGGRTWLRRARRLQRDLILRWLSS